MSKRMRPVGFLAVFGPGLLTAATGVGAGDLATAGFAGSMLGMAVLWAVVIGAGLKFVLTEGVARWQLATGTTVLEGAIGRLGRWAGFAFLIYLLPWSFVVGAALISACGVTAHAMVPGLDDRYGPMLLGALHSGVGVLLVWGGGFKLFERVMAGCIAVMFVIVVTTAVLLRPDVGELVTGLLVPRVPQAGQEGLAWTIALMGGVGGTLTVLCYGYWIREKGRAGPEALRTCRIDLGVGYAATAIFGLAMVVIASRVEVEGRGTQLIIVLADELGRTLGPVGRWAFIIGAWAAVFSSMLGVWQAVPSIFADLWGHMRRGAPGQDQARPGPNEIDQRGLPYRGFLLALAIVPLIQIQQDFRDVQKVYAIIGAAFIPLLAVALLVLNGRQTWVGALRNRPVTVAVLVISVVLFAIAGVYQVMKTFGA